MKHVSQLAAAGQYTVTRDISRYCTSWRRAAPGISPARREVCPGRAGGGTATAGRRAQTGV